jgi:hypothetical protein
MTLLPLAPRFFLYTFPTEGDEFAIRAGE